MLTDVISKQSLFLPGLVMYYMYINNPWPDGPGNTSIKFFFAQNTNLLPAPEHGVLEDGHGAGPNSRVVADHPLDERLAGEIVAEGTDGKYMMISMPLLP